MRRFFLKLELLKPIVALGKRERDHQSPVVDILEKQKSSQAIDRSSPLLIDSSSFIVPQQNVTDRIQQQQPTTRQSIARIALQQHDQPLDAIVITTLPSYPFCCHEDLLMMSRPQLVEAGLLLNSRLPACSQIELANGVPDAHIRHSIETLVGIVPDMPGAPKAVKFRRFETRDTDSFGDLELQDTLPSPPTSPLSMRVSRRQEKALPVLSSPPHLLERLEEEDENDFFTMNRPLKKKRKVIRSMKSMLDKDMDIEGGTLIRARDFPSMHVSNQQSSPSPLSSPNVFKVDRAFINMKPRYRSMDARKRSGRKVASAGSPRKPAEKKTITLNYRPFEFPTNNSGRYHMRTTPLSSKSSNASDEKAAEEESDNSSWFGNHNSGISPVEHDDNQVTGGIENLTVGCD